MLFPTMLMRAILSDPFIPTDATRIFALINHAKDCLAVLESSFGATLSDKDETQIVERITPLAQYLNLTFHYHSNPFDTQVICDFVGKHPSEVEVDFCGQRPDLSFHGTLNFQYLHHLFNSTEIKNILEQSTTRNCGNDTLGIAIMILGGIVAVSLGMLILGGITNCLYKTCRKSASFVAARQRVTFKTNYETMSTTTERTGLVNAAPTEPNNDDAKSALTLP